MMQNLGHFENVNQSSLTFYSKMEKKSWIWKKNWSFSCLHAFKIPDLKPLWNKKCQQSQTELLREPINPILLLKVCFIFIYWRMFTYYKITFSGQRHFAQGKCHVIFFPFFYRILACSEQTKYWPFILLDTCYVVMIVTTSEFTYEWVPGNSKYPLLSLWFSHESAAELLCLTEHLLLDIHKYFQNFRQDSSCSHLKFEAT